MGEANRPRLYSWEIEGVRQFEYLYISVFVRSSAKQLNHHIWTVFVHLQCIPDSCLQVYPVLAMSLLTMAGPRYGRFGGEYSFTTSNNAW